MSAALHHLVLSGMVSSRITHQPFVAARPGRSFRLKTVAQATGGGQDSKGKQKAKNQDPMTAYRPPSMEGASLRAEAEAPFRGLRFFLFGAGLVGAGLATLFGLPQLIGALGNAPGSTKSATEALQDFAINIGSLTFFGFLVRRDLKAREKQMARLMREDELGSCQLELANKRVLRLGQLRGFARTVMVAGTPSQVAAALAEAEHYKEALQERGVLVVPLPFVPETSTSSGSSGSGSSSADAAAAAVAAEVAAASLAPPGKVDLRWRATPIRMDDWRRWFEQQAKMAGKSLSGGLYVSLRMDGRVRGSGSGCPPWAQLAQQLPPTDGFFGGLFDGMDGVIDL